MNRRLLVLLLAVVVQIGLVGYAVAPRLSARVAGDEYVLRVAPVDPLDPFRGAFVALDYPDLPAGEELPDGAGDSIYVPLVEEGDVWVGGAATRSRPDDGPYLACAGDAWELRCGIDSWFLPQDEARALEQQVVEGDAVARIRVDRWGNAALVAVEAD
jgi:uncharacterized membrane-anchored protein